MVPPGGKGLSKTGNHRWFFYSEMGGDSQMQEKPMEQRQEPEVRAKEERKMRGASSMAKKY